MTDTLYLCLSILTMALVTYLVRMLPLAAIRRKITSPFVLSFLCLLYTSDAADEL